MNLITKSIHVMLMFVIYSIVFYFFQIPMFVNFLEIDAEKSMWTFLFYLYKNLRLNYRRFNLLISLSAFIVILRFLLWEMEWQCLSGGKPPAGKGVKIVVEIVCWAGTEFITFCIVRHGDCVT